MRKEIIIGSSIIFIMDQVSKFLIEHFFKNKVLVVIPNLFNIDFTYNKGGAFSILNDQIVLLILATIVCLFILVKISKEVKPSIFKTFIFSLLYGGIIGNLFDRVFFYSVRDFLDFKFFEYHFPTFNIADMAIVCGMFLLIIELFRKSDKHAKDNC